MADIQIPKQTQATEKNQGNSPASRFRSLHKQAARRSIRIVQSGRKQTVKVARGAHHHVVKRPHNYMNDNWAWYARWHNWKWHKPVHNTLVAGYVLVVAVFVFSSLVRPVLASGNWLQDDWSGGVGTNATNQYSSASGIDATTANQLTLAKGANKFSNSTFDSNVTGWNGQANSHDTSQSYSASGSAKITAAVSSGQHFGTANYYNSSTTYPTYLTGGDVNGDGRQDLIAGSNGSTTSNVMIYLANVDGTLGSPTALNAAPIVLSGIEAVDMNLDGYADIALTYSNYNYMSVFLNDGAGNFSGFTNYNLEGISGTRNCNLETGRFNNDSFPDVAVICTSHNDLYVLINNGSGGLSSATAYVLTNTVSMGFLNVKPAVGDINGDGYDDIAGPSNANCNFDYFINNGSGSFTKTNQVLTTCGTSGVANWAVDIVDIDNDAKSEILLPRYTGTGGSGDAGNYITVFKGASIGLGAQTNLTTTATPGNIYSLIHGDFNADGYQDLIVSNTGFVQVLVNSGSSTFTPQSNIPFVSGAYNTIATVDFDGDGKLDIGAGLRINSTSNSIFTILNKSQGDTLTQPVNVGNTNTYQLEAYVRTDGSSVTSADATLFYNGAEVSTTYAATATAGWYKLTGTITGVALKKGYGVLAKHGKTVYVDNINLYEYDSSGTLTSAVFDPGYGGAWDVLGWNTSEAASVSVKIRTSENSNMSGATSFASCNAATSGQDISSNNCVTDGDRYIQYQIALTRVNGDTPVFSDIDLAYAAFDIIPPDTNASDISMSKANGGPSISLNGWTNGGSPYFEWTAGADNVGGVGIAGYCAYLGTDGSADPETTKGMLGTSQVPDNTACPFIVTGTSLDLATSGLLETALTTSNSAYHLRLKAVDVVGNVYASTAEDFYFRFDNTLPTNPAYLSAPSQFINTKTATITWPNSGGGAPDDGNSGLAGLQYRINNTAWYGDDHTGAGDINDLLDNDGSYTTIDPTDFDNINDGINTIYFRTWDNAGNVTVTYVTVPLKVNTNGSPSEPQNITATPPTNTENEFAFSWAAPATFVGAANTLQYCYTVNALPTSGNCNYTAAGETSIAAGPYATQPGVNTLYVVARDESNNINYSSFGSVQFTANTPAPGIPQNIDVADVSVKATENWRLAITWDEPVNVGAGVTSYRVFRSTDNNNFSQVGSSASTSFVDTGLSQVEYFYKVRACDSANNCGAYTGVSSQTPTGKFTEPAVMTSEPVISGVTTKRATITWSTDRASDSKVAIGVASGDYSPSEVGNSSQVTAHKLDMDNLAAGTTYYFQARWTDTDGNTGVSQEYSFTTAPAPLLKEVDTLAISLSSVTLQFTVKDSTNVEVQYGLSDAFGGVKAINTSLAESTYELELNGLNDGVKYFYRLIMQDTEGGKYQSSIFSFTTPPRPAIANLRFQPLEGEPTSTQQVTWTTNIPTNSIVQYGKVGTDGTLIQAQEFKTTHEVIIRGLEDNSEYFLIAQGRDASGNLAVSDRQEFKTALDTRPPSIFDIVIEPTIRGTGAEARGQIVVSWRTDEPSTSQVAYAEGSAVTTFNNRTAEDAQLTTEHLVIVSDLPPSRVYSIMPVSKDKSGNSSTTKPQAAIIGRASDSVLNIVLNTLRKVFGL